MKEISEINSFNKIVSKIKKLKKLIKINIVQAKNIDKKNFNVFKRTLVSKSYTNKKNKIFETYYKEGKRQFFLAKNNKKLLVCSFLQDEKYSKLLIQLFGPLLLISLKNYQQLE